MQPQSTQCEVLGIKIIIMANLEKYNLHSIFRQRSIRVFLLGFLLQLTKKCVMFLRQTSFEPTLFRHFSSWIHFKI